MALPDVRPRRPRALALQWERLRSKVSEVGLAYSLERAVARFVPRSLFELIDATVYELRVDDAVHYRPTSDPVRWLKREDVRSDQEPFVGRPVTARLEEGARAAVIAGSERIDAIVWVQAGRSMERRRVEIQLQEGELWSLEAWVTPERRGHRLFPSIKHFIAAELKREGGNRILSRVDRRNHNSIRANLALGARPAGRLFLLSLLGMRMLKATGTPVQIGFGGSVFAVNSKVFKSSD